MSDDDVSQLLRKALRLKKRPPVTDEEVEALISAPPAPPGTGERVRARFVQKAFLEKRPTPTRFNEIAALPFWSLIAEMRKDALVTRREVSDVLGLETSLLGRLESGEVLPWLVDAETVAGLLKLYRLHFTTAEDSISAIPDSWRPHRPPPRRAERRDSLSNTFLEDRGGGDDREQKPEVVRWLADLRGALVRLDAADLLN